MKIKDLKKYYSEKTLEDYRVDYLYHNITEVINQVIRVKIIKEFFGKYLKPSNNKVLDLGCGNGNDIINLNKTYSKKITNFVGVDLGKKTIESLNSMNIKNCKFIVCDIENLNLGEKFDIVLSSEVAEHLANFEGHLDTIKKHLTPGGYLILSTPNEKYLMKDIYKLLRYVFKPKSIEKVKEKHVDEEDEEHINVMPYNVLKEKLEAKDFEIIDKKRTMIMFGADYAEPYYGIIAFIDNILPKKIMYLGNGVVIAARIKK